MDARFLAYDAEAGPSGPSSEAGLLLGDITDSVGVGDPGGATRGAATIALVVAPGALCEPLVSPAIASPLRLPGPAPLAFADGLRSRLATLATPCSGQPPEADGRPGRSEAGVMRCGASGQRCVW